MSATALRCSLSGPPASITGRVQWYAAEGTGTESCWSEPVAVKPVNLRPISDNPVFRDRPREQTDGAAQLRWRFGEPAWSSANVATRSHTSSSGTVAAPRQPERREPAQRNKRARYCSTAATYFEDLTDTQHGRMRLPPVIAIGHNAHTPPLQDLLESYQHPIVCIRRLSHSWYAVGRYNEAGGIVGRWMVPASALGEICCNGLFDRELHALTASYVLERQAAQQRAAAHATAYQPPRERPGMAQHPAVFKSESTDLQTAGRSASEYEWQEEQRVLTARRMAHVHVPGGDTLAAARKLRRHASRARRRPRGEPSGQSGRSGQQRWNWGAVAEWT